MSVGFKNTRPRDRRTLTSSLLLMSFMFFQVSVLTCAALAHLICRLRMVSSGPTWTLKAGIPHTVSIISVGICPESEGETAGRPSVSEHERAAFEPAIVKTTRRIGLSAP